MPPRIEWVQWGYTPPLPRGLKFDEETGTFSGTPIVLGEYTVPVFVETEFGSDIKDVKIKVKPKPYSVYAKGSKAASWANGGTVNSDGFYGLQIPKMHEVYSWPNGFRAYNLDGIMYGCGVSGTISTPNERYWPPSNHWESTTVPARISNAPGISYAIFTLRVNSSATAASGAAGRYVTYILYSSDREGQGYSQGAVHDYLVYTSDGRIQKETVFLEHCGNGPGNGYIVPTLSMNIKYSGGVSLTKLSQDKTKKLTGIVTTSNSSGRASISYTTTDLGFTAKKAILTNPAIFLPEDSSVAAEVLSFSNGNVADAWFNDYSQRQGQEIIVKTTNGDIYSGLFSSAGSIGEWEFLGSYDVKKVDSGFFLMNNGNLYYKGNSLSGIAGGSYSTLTHIYPSLSFVDIALCKNIDSNNNLTSSNPTLVVLIDD